MATVYVVFCTLATACLPSQMQVHTFTVSPPTCSDPRKLDAAVGSELRRIGAEYKIHLGAGEFLEACK